MDGSGPEAAGGNAIRCGHAACALDVEAVLRARALVVLQHLYVRVVAGVLARELLDDPIRLIVPPEPLERDIQPEVCRGARLRVSRRFQKRLEGLRGRTEFPFQVV